MRILQRGRGIKALVALLLVGAAGCAAEIAASGVEDEDGDVGAVTEALLPVPARCAPGDYYMQDYVITWRGNEDRCCQDVDSLGTSCTSAPMPVLCPAWRPNWAVRSPGHDICVP